MSKDYKVGDIVWAKLRGHPWWPSRIEDEEYIPEIVLKQKPRNGNVIPVFFFGSRDYGWFASETLKPFEQHKKDFIKKKNTILFDKAVQQAMDPTILEKEIEREKAEYEEEEEEEEEEEPEEEEEEEEEEKPVKKTSKRSRTATQKNENSRKRRKEESTNSKSTDSKKKSTTVEAAPISLTSESEEASPKVEQSKELKKDNEEKKKSEEIQKKKDHKHKRHGGSILKTRVKIQKLLTANFEDDHIKQKASDLLKEADTFNMTLDILRETKIGKVVKKFSQLPIKDDSLNLIQRATGLLLKWKSVVTPHQHASGTTANQVETPTSATEQEQSNASESLNENLKPKEKPEDSTIAAVNLNEKKPEKVEEKKEEEKKEETSIEEIK